MTCIHVKGNNVKTEHLKELLGVQILFGPSLALYHLSRVRVRVRVRFQHYKIRGGPSELSLRLTIDNVSNARASLSFGYFVCSYALTAWSSPPPFFFFILILKIYFILQKIKNIYFSRQ